MAKRKTIGENPLDAVVPKQTAPRATAEPKAVVKERLTIHLPVELIDRIKNAVFWTPGLTLAAFGEQAFSELLDRLEKERGEPFPPRKAELKGGRPLK